jgi:hypothetical protein
MAPPSSISIEPDPLDPEPTGGDTETGSCFDPPPPAIACFA